MFFVTYLRRELRRRMRQAIFIALGLALGVGLVVTVAAASAGVKTAQSKVLSALYGVGTDVTVTGAAPGPPKPGQAPRGVGQEIQLGPNGPEQCTSSGKCTSMAGKTQDNLAPPYSAISASKVAAVAGLHGVAAAAGGLTLQDLSVTFPKNFGAGSAPPQPNSFTVDGVDTGHTSLGPLSGASLTSGHSFTAAESDSYVAVVDSGYAKSHSLKVSSVVTITQVKYTVIGIVSQPQASSPPDVYIPLARAQAFTTIAGSLKNDVNTIYVTAASAADVSAVQKEISGLLPGATVTTASSLASQVTGSVSSAASLADNLGRWLSVLVLIAAFAVASLLTMAAVARRAREFGTLKAIGWRSRRIVAQVLGESVVMGIAGAAAGVGLGFAGAAIIAGVAPKLSATVGGNTGPQASAPPGARQIPDGATSSHVVSVPLHPSVSVGVIILAVVLAVAGGLLAGALGSWRIAGLRPADALARVA
jgi:putative ABC transport system permease protein